MTWESLIEDLAAIEHCRWAHWQKYLHNQCQRQSDGSLTIPPHLVRRWEAQIDTPYDQLSEQEKESDRQQVRKVLPTLKRFFRTNPSSD
jgi:hypothetical protein